MKNVYHLFTAAALVLFPAAMILASCDKNDSTPSKEKEEEQEQEEPPVDTPTGITIDGDFSDWAALPKSAYVFALNDPDSEWEGVEQIRVCADEENIYYYVAFNRDVIADYLAENDLLPCRLNLNTDNEFTSGYSNYFLQAYDFIIEGELGDGSGSWGVYDGKLYQRIDGSWVMLADSHNGLTEGAGRGVEYEIALSREEFNTAARKSTIPMPIEEVIQTSMRFYETSTTGKWKDFSNMPNGPLDENDGLGDLLELTL